jgi:5-formyltetrahydrofolate cyclo-ligase
LNSTDPDLKAELRRSALARRKALGPDVRAQLTARLVREGLRLAGLWKPAVVSAFHPIRQEPDALALLGALADEGFDVALPLVRGSETHLDFRLWRPGEPTALGPMGIPEPLEDAPLVDPDLLFTPLACYDRRGRRIGYGAGFYDRTLLRLRAMKTIRAVGVAYGVCEVAVVPYEAHDQTLDAIVTEQETIFVSER